MQKAWLVVPILILFGSSPAAAQAPSAQPPGAERPPAAASPEKGAPEKAAPEKSPKEKIDALLETLRSTKDEKEADRAENAILEAWLKSGSDTVDLLMEWSLEAVEEKKYALAIDLLDSVTTLKPDFAEGWNKRATVYFMTGDYGQALADIEHALRLEPRHFGALSGLGLILRDVGQEGRALTVFRRALEINPTLKKVREALEEIEKDEAGQET